MVYMALVHNPSVVRSGLVLHLDAANVKSYPGSGTVWTDLSGRGYNFNLVNGPTFNTLNGGGIEQDGSNDYIERAYTTDLAFGGNTSLTIQITAKTKTMRSPYGYQALASCGDQFGQGGWHLIMYDDNNIYGGAFGTIAFVRFTTGNYVVAGGECGYNFQSLADANSMNFWCYTYSSTDGGKFYRNSVLTSSNATTGSIVRSSNLPVRIGSRGSAVATTNCIIYQALMYNRALTAAEVGQNFEATRDRYGI